ncbi:hypothetical protein ACQR35_04075 [Pseudarthrobacter sp. J1738]|uniref:PH-like domain-containing protein n=1 Tax=Pseudarthrobacter sp. J1738 TaxID=3420446 RepID=UPI003D2A345F
MDKIIPGIVMLLVALAVIALLGVGWRNRLKRQSDVQALEPLPEHLGDASLSVAGQYVATTSAGDWLDRIAVHSLGIRTLGELHVYPGGIVIDRAGASAIYISSTKLTGVRTESGMAGKFVANNGLTVISWWLGDKEVDTGFRVRVVQQREQVLDAIATLIPNNILPAENSDEVSRGN